jgi:hypothetical protein
MIYVCFRLLRGEANNSVGWVLDGMADVCAGFRGRELGWGENR